MINISHEFFVIAHDVILQLNIDVSRQPARQFPLLKESGYATVAISFYTCK